MWLKSKERYKIKEKSKIDFSFLNYTLFTFIFSFLCFEWSILCQISSLERSKNYLKRMCLFDSVCKCWSGNWVWYNSIFYKGLYNSQFLCLFNFCVCWECKISEMNSLRHVGFLRHIARSLFNLYFLFNLFYHFSFLEKHILTFSINKVFRKTY